MLFTFLTLTIYQSLPCLVNAAYNKDVVCLIEKDKTPTCKRVEQADRRSGVGIIKNIPSHDPYIPRANSVLYNCSNLECTVLTLNSLTELSSPATNLKTCYKQLEDYECEPIRFHRFMPVDKLAFLTHKIKTKKFYSVDCLVYPDRGRVCHKKDSADSHGELVDTGTMARPQEPNILAQSEFICEESADKVVNCDHDAFVPYEDGLRSKENVETLGNVLLKSGSYVIILKNKCIGHWCGYSGRVETSRRVFQDLGYDPPGGKIFKCYYAKKQQVCKELYSPIGRSVYNNREMLSLGK